MKGPEIMVVKEMTFDAAHFLPCYSGPCHRLHGHTYKLQIGIKGAVDGKTGMVCDFTVLKSIMNELVELLDHRCLNDVQDENFPNQNPTAELMLVWFASKMIDKLSELQPSHLVLPAFIRLWETPTSYAELRI